MGFIRKLWKNRVSEYPTRRVLTKADGTTETVTVTRSEGTISAEGDAFSANNMNDLEARIEAGFGNCAFSVQSDGAYVTYTPTGGADPVSKKLGSGMLFRWYAERVGPCYINIENTGHVLLTCKSITERVNINIYGTNNEYKLGHTGSDVVKLGGKEFTGVGQTLDLDTGNTYQYLVFHSTYDGSQRKATIEVNTM